MDVESIYHPVGCSECINGYHGRIAIQEVLILNQEIRDAIINNVRKDALRKLVYDKVNVKTLLEDGLLKVIQGITSFEEILRVIDVDDDLGESDMELKKAIMGKMVNNKDIETL